MGVLRFILALAVVVVHTAYVYGSTPQGLWLPGGVVAVQAFYMLSGFYMALILDAKYVGPGSYKLFITNRLLKIFPAYWLILFSTLVLSSFPSFTHMFGFTLQRFFEQDWSVSTLLYLVIINLVLFGQDLVLFQGIDANGGLFFTSNFTAVKPELFTFMPLPQAWTLSLELMFYVLAPFFARRQTWILLCFILASVTSRFLVYFAGFNADPWTYRFFPFELAFFLAGMVSFRFYQLNRLTKFAPKLAPYLATLFVLGLTVCYQLIPANDYRLWLYYLVVFTLMPYLFMFSNLWRSVDAAVGELSYPIYVSHVFIMLVLSPLLKTISPSIYIHLIVCAATVTFSIALNYLLLAPLDEWRQARLRRSNESDRRYRRGIHWALGLTHRGE